ncbi:hypothetical protein Pelo_1181 [Pelomyxa schiedti]|nr:hypothetical protein Pelo_1181 [Pelomyxa schiedti]
MPSEPAPDPAVADPRRDLADYIRVWCSLCGCTRPARIQPLVVVAETAPPPASALHEEPMYNKPCVVKKETEIEVAVTEQDQEQEDATESPTPTDPKRRKACPRGHAEVGFWWWCSMCQAAGYAGVAAKFMCAECTKMLPEGGTTPMMYCGSCWPKAHWAPWMISHVKADPSSSSYSSSGVELVPQVTQESHLSALSPTQSRMRMCESHQLPIDFVCETDGSFLCQKCASLHDVVDLDIILLLKINTQKGHSTARVEDICLKKKPHAMGFLLQLAKLETDLNLLAASIKCESANLKPVHNKFEETVHQEFNELRSRLQKREEDVLSMSRSISSTKACSLSRQLDCVSAGLAHVEKYKSKFDSMLATGDPFSVVELCDSIPGILKQLECKPEHLSPCANSFLSCRTDDAEHMKSQIPQMCFISTTGPILTCIKEELLPNSADTTGANAAAHPGCFKKSATNRGNQPRVGDSSSCKGPEITEVSKLHQQGGKLKIRGRGFGESRQAISVSVNNVVCGRILLSKPHTEITCSAPSVAPRHAHEGTLILTVAGQHVSSSISFGWEWDPDSCGDCLAIQPDDSTTVRKPPRSPLHNKQSTVTTTTQIIGEGVYEWHLSISNLTAVDNNNGTMCHWVAYGLIPKPVFQDSETPLGSIMYGWTTGGDHMLGPSGTAFFADGSLPPPGQQSTAAAAATGGCEDVMLRYSPVAHTLTATCPCRNNITMVIGNVPKGLYPAVNIFGHNTVRIESL